MTQPPRDFFWRAGRTLVRHQALAIPLAYVGLILLGMFHMALFFAHFRLNALDFAEPSDFLLAPLSDPLVILVSIAPFFLFAALRPANRWYRAYVDKRRKKPLTEAQRARQEQSYARMGWLATALWILAFSLTYARWRSERIEDGNVPRVRVQLMNGQRLGSARDSTVALIGATTQYCFFYAGRRDSSTGPPSVTIVPVVNVARMDLDAPRHRLRRGR